MFAHEDRIVPCLVKRPDDSPHERAGIWTPSYYKEWPRLHPTIECVDKPCLAKYVRSAQILIPTLAISNRTGHQRLPICRLYNTKTLFVLRDYYLSRYFSKKLS